MSIVTVHYLSMLQSASVTIPAITSGASANFTWEGLPANELVVIDWGDGSAVSTGTANGSGALTVAHTYAYAGEFTQTVYSTTSVDGTLDGTAVVVETTKGVEAVSPVNEVQVITVDAVGGNFTLTYDGQTTGNIAYNANSSTVQTALLALSNLAPGDVTVAGDGPHTVTFGGTLAATDVEAITADDSGLTAPSVVVAQGTQGDDDPATNEVQTVTVSATGGTYTLTYDGQTTAAIDFDADSAAVDAALEALSNIGPGDVTVTGDGPHSIEFTGALAATNVPLITANGANLTGNTVDVTVDTEGVEEVVAVNEVQTLTILANGGTYTLTYDGETTTPLAYNASAATIQTALRALSNIGATDVNVSGTGTTRTITFVNALAATDVVLIASGGDVIDSAVVNVPGKVTAPSAVLAGVSTGNFSFVLRPSVVYTVNWDDLSTSTFTTNGSGVGTAAHTYATSGTYSIEVKDPSGSPALPNISYTVNPSFTLTYGGETTAPIALNASAATVDTALTALSNIGATDVAVTGDAGGPYEVEFTNTLAATDVDLIEATHSEGETITVEESTPGDDDPATNEVQTITLP